MDITLEKFGPQDFADYFQVDSNPEVMSMITERAIPADEAQRDYEKLLPTMPFTRNWATSASLMSAERSSV